MLQNIRERFTGRFALVVLALICLPFLFFGVPNDFIATEDVASVDDINISQPYFENQYQNEMLRYDSEGIEIPDEARIFVRQNVLNNIINDVLTEKFINENGINISDEFIARVIQSSPEFMIDGQFSRDRYYTWLNERVIEPSLFEENQRINIRKGQLERGIRATSFVTPSEYRRYLNLIGEQRNVTIAEIDLSVLADPINLEEEDIQEYYSSRSNEFLQPESIDFSYIELRKDQLNNDLEITDDEILQYYNDSGQRFAQDERRQASHILILLGEDEALSLQRANDTLERINNGESFSDLVLAISDDEGSKRSDGDLGMLPRSQLPGALGDAIFSMAEGEISEVVRTDFGFHIVRLDRVESDGKVPLELVESELKQELILQKAGQNFTDQERALSDALFDADNLSQLADIIGLEVMTEEFFSSQGGGSFGSNQIVIDAVFDAHRDNNYELSDILEIDANRSIVFQIEGYNEAKVRPLGDVRDTIVADMKLVSAEVLANDIATRLESLLIKGESIQEVANELSSVTTVNKLMNRASEDDDFMLQASVFGEKRSKDGVPRIGTVIMSNGNYAVYSVTESIYGIPESIPQNERDDARELLNQRSGLSDYSAFISELEQRADITKNDEIISSSSLFD
jgi:peptidyl-prolyl cis-trans isomerase D